MMELRVTFCICLLLGIASTSWAFLDRSPEKLNQEGSETTTERSEDTGTEFPLPGILNSSPNPVIEENVEQAEPIQVLNTVDCQCGVRSVENDISKIPLFASDATVDQDQDEEKEEDVLPGGAPVPLIIMGEDARPREFPWMAAITKKKWDGKQHVVCGGSLLNSKFVVTAAHCIKNQIMQRMQVVFNVHNASHEAVKGDKMVEIRKIRRFIVHPGWNEKNVDNDIGLIELATPIDFKTSPARPICLPRNYSHTDFDGKNGTVAGWGYTTPGGKNSELLKKVTVPIYSMERCQEDTIYGDKILPSMVCAGYQKGSYDACTNDSGGPLVVEDNGRQILVGIVSWGHGCAKPKAPGVYARVTQYTDWLSKQLVKGDSCSA